MLYIARPLSAMQDKSSIQLLSNPPLVEVIFGLRAVTPSHLGEKATQEVLAPKLPGGFHIEQVGYFDSTEGPEILSTSEWAGIKVRSTDQKLIVHFMRNGLFVNFLKPYRGFVDSLPLVKQFWEIYVEVMQPETMVGPSLRYINVIDIPLTDGRFKIADYFKVVTSFSTHDQFDLHRFHHQMVLSDPAIDIPARLILTSLGDSTETKNVKVCLDIEGFLDKQLPTSSAAIWQDLEAIRRWTYKLFLSTLQPSCIAPYR